MLDYCIFKVCFGIPPLTPDCIVRDYRTLVDTFQLATTAEGQPLLVEVLVDPGILLQVLVRTLWWILLHRLRNHLWWRFQIAIVLMLGNSYYCSKIIIYRSWKMIIWSHIRFVTAQCPKYWRDVVELMRWKLGLDAGWGAGARPRFVQGWGILFVSFV